MCNRQVIGLLRSFIASFAILLIAYIILDKSPRMPFLHSLLTSLTQSCEAQASICAVFALQELLLSWRSKSVNPEEVLLRDYWSFNRGLHEVMSG